MKRECLRLIGNEKPLSQAHKPRQYQNIHIVAEVVDGRIIKTRLPKEEAEALFRKIRSTGANVNLYKEV